MSSSLFPSLTSTTEQALFALTYNLRRNALDNFMTFVFVQNEFISNIWHNPAFSAQTICDALSSDAVHYFNLTNNLRAMVLSGMADNDFSMNILYPLSAYSLSGDHVTIFNEPYIGP